MKALILRTNENPDPAYKWKPVSCGYSEYSILSFAPPSLNNELIVGFNCRLGTLSELGRPDRLASDRLADDRPMPIDLWQKGARYAKSLVRKLAVHKLAVLSMAI
jgi:hypothetical protein